MSKKIKQVLEKALLEAGHVLSAAFGRPKHIEYKGTANLVTKTDRAAEKKIINLIRRNFPEHVILSEESFPAHLYHTDRSIPVKWVVDPLDGTTNFAHNLPLACVTIGIEMYGKLTLGGVWNPFSGEMFWAEKGRGAFLNGKRIHVSKTNLLSTSLLVTGFPYDRNKYADQYLKVAGEFMRRTHGIRRLGSSALDLCFVASGRFDGYWETKLHPWDQAAGVLIVEEAGGRTSDFSGNPINIYGKQTLATNGKIHGEMLKVLKPFLSKCKALSGRRQ